MSKLNSRLSWLMMLLCLALLAVSVANVRCLTDDKSSEPSIEQEDLFDADLLENLEYDALDESENGYKQDYNPQQQSNYGQQAYGSAPPQPVYSPPPPVYSQPPPVYSQPPPVYSPPPPPPSQPQQQQVYAQPQPQPQYNPVPVPNYTVTSEPYAEPAPIYEALMPVYVPVSAPASNYSQPQAQPVYETVSYTQPAAYKQPPALYTPPQQTYSQPQPQPQQTYAQPQSQPQQTYAQPQSQPQQTYAQPQSQPQQTYAQPQSQPQQTYAQPQPQPQSPPQQQQSVSYQQPAIAQQAAYRPAAPVPAPVPVPAQVPYSSPKPVVVVVVPQPQANYQKPPAPQNYTVQKQPTAVVYKPQPVQPIVYKQQPQQYVAALIQKYSGAELAPFISPLGYRANHWSLYYYRGAQNPYVQHLCPKNPYSNGPSYKDIEVAFIEALAQLGQYKQPTYSNASHPSFAARHQIFSLLSQKNARMDEEGLLVEMVSRYLADRLCLTKWDKQRYLPQLTKFVSTSQFPIQHSCSNYYRNGWKERIKYCATAKYRSFDGFCNNLYHPYWGAANVCHIRLLSPDYADGISLPRVSTNPRYPLPNARQISNTIHNDISIDSPYNLMKMQWGQFINHDITNTALSAYDGLVDCCKQPQARGCWPIYVPPGDRFYGPLNVTCLNFIRSGVCPLCQLGPRQQSNKNTAYIDASHVYGHTQEQSNKLRTFRTGQLATTVNPKGEPMLPLATSQDQCSGVCYGAGDSRVNQHPALTALHLLLLRNHNIHAQHLAQRHPDWTDEILFQEARRINIAEYQMITYNEYFPIVFGPILSAYYQLIPQRSGYTQYNYQVDPTTWNEYSTATCRFGHSQIQSTFGLYSRILSYGQQEAGQQTFRLKDWFMRPSLLNDGQLVPIINGLLGKQAQAVDPWVTNDVRNHLYQSHLEHAGGDLPATNVWRGRDHGIPGYVHYVEYCFNHKVRGWRDLALFIPPTALNQLRRLYRVVENIDLFTGGMSERHFPGADIGPTFACVNGIQYYHLKFGDRYYFEHANQAGSFAPPQLDEIRRSTLARLLCRTANLGAAPQFAFLSPSVYNPLLNCSQIGDFNYNAF